MSSGTRYEPDAARKVTGGLSQKVMDTIERLGLSPRQQRLNHLYSWYRCEHYSTRRFDWNGGETLDPIEREAIASRGVLPGGFVDAGAQTMPVQFRRPTAPYAIITAIVNRFSGLLFSQRRHPIPHVEGDAKTEDFVAALAEAGRLWQTMMLARMYGGSMGTVAVGFQFVNGRPVIEAHDPRWLTPKFESRGTFKLAAIEKRYQYPIEVRDPETGAWVEEHVWYRRLIDDQRDVVFAPAPVTDGEPEWKIENVVEHGLGFCPVVWTQNIPVHDDIDGDPDCPPSVYEQAEAIDSLVAQAYKGTVNNCDPTTVITTDSELIELRKGSDNALKLRKGDNASYLELSGSGPKSAMDLADKFRAWALEVSQCVLEHPDVANRTATEIERVYESMFAKADIMREQYGERCVKPLLEMMVKAAKKVGTRRVNDETGQVERGFLTLAPRYERAEDGSVVRVEREVGEAETVTLQWPRYVDPTLSEVTEATRAAGQAKASGLLDSEHAVKYTAPFFGIEDVPQLVEKIDAEAEAKQSAFSQQAMPYLPRFTPQG